MILSFNPPCAVVISYSHANVQGRRSIGFEGRVETDGWTGGEADGGDCIISLANAVGNLISTDDDKTVVYWLPVANYT